MPEDHAHLDRLDAFCEDDFKDLQALLATSSQEALERLYSKHQPLELIRHDPAAISTGHPA